MRQDRLLVTVLLLLVGVPSAPTQELKERANLQFRVDRAELSPDGKVLLQLGKAGVAGDGPDTFNQPSGVVVAANGDIFVADGHGGNSNARVVKFSIRPCT